MKTKSRGNGQGSIYRSPNGKSWTAQVVIGWKGNTPVKRKKSGFQTRKEAAEYLHILKEKPAERPQKAPNLAYYWELYKEGEYAKLSRSKQANYNTAWNRLEKLHDTPVNMLTVESLRKTVSEKCATFYTAKDCKNILTHMFKLAAADGYVSKDLPSFIVLPKLEETERQPFTQKEQQSMWSAYKAGCKEVAIPLILIYTGMMPGEAMSLKPSDIDLKGKKITGIGIKTDTRKKTPIVIANVIIPLLKERMKGEYVFEHDKKKFYAAYYGALEKANVRKLTPYSCRHTTATALAVTEGIAPQTVRQVMRWSTSNMLDRYAHPTTDDALTAVNTIGGSRGGSSKRLSKTDKDYPKTK